MISRNASLARLLALGLCLSPALVFSGCGEDDPPPPPPPAPKRDPKPVTPPWEEVAEVMNLSDKLALGAAGYQDVTRDQMIAAFQFIDAFARGDAEALRPMLDSSARMTLDDLVASGEWQEQTAAINLLTLTTCAAEGGQVRLAFSLLKSDGDLVNLVWEGTRRGESYLFSPVAPQLSEGGAAADGEGVPLGEPKPETTESGDDDDRPTRDPRRLVPKSPGRGMGAG